MSSMASRPRSGKRRIRSPALRTKRSARRGVLGRVPSAAEGLDQTDAGAHLDIHGLRQRQLVGQERPLGVDDDEVVGQALPVLHLGETKVVLRCADRLAQGPDLLGEGVQVGQGVFDVAIGDQNLIHVRGHGLVVADRKSTRLNSSHGYISYAVFCLKKKNTTTCS